MWPRPGTRCPSGHRFYSRVSTRGGNNALEDKGPSYLGPTYTRGRARPFGVDNGDADGPRPGRICAYLGSEWRS